MSSSFQKGQILGRYELLLPLARGGMAEVWAARLHGTRGFQKLVAIKTMLPGVIEDERAERMFMDEAGLACQIQHPNVVEIIELGEDNGTLFLVMEWIDGEPLNAVLKRTEGNNSIPVNIAVNLTGQCCKGLEAAHELKDERGQPLGVVHRDVSPHNILVSYSGTVKIVDFGIAKVTSQNVALTEAGEVKGKLAYMSPEHLSGKPVDRRSDIFALGIVLYQLSTGRHPFKGDTPGETVRNTTAGRPTPPTELVEGYPADLERIVLKALEPRPEKRYATARSMLLDLQQALPAALDHGADAETARFLAGLLGDRIQSKKQAIKSAIELSQFDPTVNMTQVTVTNQSGTMGAVTSDDPGSYEHLTQLLMQNRAATRRQAVIGTAAATVAAIVVGVTTVRLSDSDAGGSSAAATGVDRGLTPSPYAVPSAPVVTDPVASADGASSVEPPESEPEVSDAVDSKAEKAAKVNAKPSPKSKWRRPKRWVRRAAKSPPAPAEPAAVAEPVKTQPAPAPAPTPQKPVDTNIDDRNKFGGRW